HVSNGAAAVCEWSARAAYCRRNARRPAAASLPPTPDSVTETPGAWRISIDTGGTFTDCLAVDPTGTLRRAKVLSSSALRGVVEAAAGPTELRVREEWGAT